MYGQFKRVCLNLLSVKFREVGLHVTYRNKNQKWLKITFLPQCISCIYPLVLLIFVSSTLTMLICSFKTLKLGFQFWVMIKQYLKFLKQHTDHHMIRPNGIVWTTVWTRLCRQGKHRTAYIHCSPQAPILQSSDLDFLNYPPLRN